MSRVRLSMAALAALSALLACSRTADTPRDDEVLVAYNAGSLARPLRAALDSFAAREKVRVEQESAGSLETARKLTELGKIPDIIALADHEIFPQLLMPRHASWYALFARNRMVVAYTDKSRYAAEMDTARWWRVLTRPDVQVGRADPSRDPNGYRTLLVLELAERFYGQPGLAARLLANAPERNVRPKEADLVGLLEAGEMDYIWSYESMAQAADLKYVHLPAAIDLSSPAESTAYRVARVRVPGSSPMDTITIVGAPIVYAMSIPAGAPHPDVAARFARWLLSTDGIRVLRSARLDALDRPVIIGTPPAELAALGTPASKAEAP
ncbi:MAG TPA: extracellular solute-binding protein [Gemmatimonadaceae bacterium]|nr:extracellular solute-binding protein [Gemmatimonadaceae bacterium]